MAKKKALELQKKQKIIFTNNINIDKINNILQVIHTIKFYY